MTAFFWFSLTFQLLWRLDVAENGTWDWGGGCLRVGSWLGAGGPHRFVLTHSSELPISPAAELGHPWHGFGMSSQVEVGVTWGLPLAPATFPEFPLGCTFFFLILGNQKCWVLLAWQQWKLLGNEPLRSVRLLIEVPKKEFRNLSLYKLFS